MAEKWIMGLDVGTASCALSAYICDDNLEATQLALLDSTVFSEPINPDNLVLLNQNRRTSRGARRQIQRRAANKRKLLHIAVSLGLDEEKLKRHEFAENIYEIRKKASEEALDIYQLFSVFLNMLQNRGAKHLKEYKELAVDITDKTLGEYLLERKEAAKDERKPWRKLQEDAENPKAYYYARFLLEAEFKQILDEQKKHHPFLEENYTSFPDGAFKKEQNKLIKYEEALRQNILEQRPLKWDINTIGDCPYEENCKVAPKAHPDYQDFRIADQIANLRLSNETILIGAQKDSIHNALHETDELTFAEIYELLNLQEKFTIDSPNNTNKSLVGNKTFHAMQKLGLVAEWQRLEKSEQAGAMLILANLPDPNYIKENSFEILQQKFTEILKVDKSYHYEPKQYQRITSFLINISTHKKFGTLTELGLEKGRGNYSAKAYSELANTMQTTHCDKTEAVVKLDYQELDLDDVVTNPIILKSIRQVKALYKDMIRKMGSPPSRITLELMRELKQSTEKRNDTNSKIKKNRGMRESSITELQKYGITPHDKNVKRLSLCKEQNYKCAYTGQSIEITQLENYEIDHIIPQAKGGGNGRSNLVLVERAINKKKGNYTPYQAYQAGIINEQGWNHIKNTAKEYRKDYDTETDKNGKKIKPRKPIGYDAILYRKAQLLTSKEEPRGIQDGAMERRNTETAYIARLLQKKLVKWSNGALKNTDIIPMRGLVTGQLRKQLNINSVLPELRLKEDRPLYNKQGEIIEKEDYDNHENRAVEKYMFDKRCDHRHHLIDAAILGLCNRSMLNSASGYYHKMGCLKGWQAQVSFASLRETLLNYLAGFVVWQKPDRYGSGGFFQETLYALKENNLLVVREPVTKLLKADYEKTLENIEKRIYDNDIKQNMLQQLKEKQAQEIPVKDAIQQIYYPKTSKNLVKRVKAIYYKKYPMTYNSEQDYYNPQTKSVQLSDGYACAVIGEKQKIQLVTKLHYKKNPKKYHENGLFKGDIVFNTKNQKFYEICSFNSQKGIFYKLANETQAFGTIKIKTLKMITASFANLELMKTKGQLYGKLKTLRKAI